MRTSIQHRPGDQPMLVAGAGTLLRPSPRYIPDTPDRSGETVSRMVTTRSDDCFGPFPRAPRSPGAPYRSAHRPPMVATTGGHDRRATQTEARRGRARGAAV